MYGVWQYWQAQGSRTYFVDEGVYTYVGWSWGQGYWPYRDSWDHKGPTVYLITMLRTLVAGTEPVALAVQEIALGVVTAGILAGIARYLWRGVTPGVALALGVLVWAQRPPEANYISTVGSLIGLFTSGAVFAALAAVRSRNSSVTVALSVIAGVCGGLAICTKPSAIAATLLGIGIILFTSGREKRERLHLGVAFVVGLTVPVVALAVAFWLSGGLGAFLDSYLIYNSTRARIVLDGRDMVSVLRDAARVLRHAGVLPLATAVLGATVLAVCCEWLRSMRFLSMNHFGLIISTTWISLELVQLISNGAYPYQVQPVFPPVAIGATGLWVYLSSLKQVPSYYGRSVVALLLVFAPLLFEVGTIRPSYEAIAQRSEQQARIVSALNAITKPDDRVLNLWDPSLLAVARRRDASRYSYSDPLYTRGYASDSRWAEVLSEIRDGDPPRVVMLGTRIVEPLPDGASTVEWALSSFDLAERRLYPQLADVRAFPQRDRLKSFIADNYRMESCSAGFCLLVRKDGPL